MSIQIPDDDLISQAIAEHQLNLTVTLVRCMLRLLFAALPAAATPELAAEIADAACAMFFALRPGDAVEAAAATRSIAANFASLQLYARAARPGLSADTARSLCASANACSRTADAALRAVGKSTRKAPAALPPEPEPEPAPLPRPVIYQFQPRDRFGKPIPLHAWEQMTMAQRRATYAPKRDPDIEAAARADEEAMIAEQQEIEARERSAAAAG
jgi:hypothetical protein